MIQRIQTDEHFVQYKDFTILHPCVAYAPNCQAKGYGDLLMVTCLFDFSDSNEGNAWYRSTDQGQTWHLFNIMDRQYVYDFANSRVKSGYGGVYADQHAGVLLYMANEAYWEKNRLDSIWKKIRLYYRLSFDNGYTWTDKRYIVQQGASYDLNRFLKDVKFGENSVYCMLRPVGTHTGTVVNGMMVQITDENLNPYNPTGMGFFKSGVLTGQWDPDRLDYLWDVKSYVSLDVSQSTRGIFEPAIEVLDDNTWIMVARGSNAGQNELPGVKFFSRSKDMGQTWSRPKPVTYDNGDMLYSSSSLPMLIKHSNGSLYYVGIINKSNPKGNLPRYPLCMAKFDPNNGTVQKESVIVLDSIRNGQVENPSCSHIVDYSNHGVYEDRKTSHIVVLAPFRANPAQAGTCLHRYVIAVDHE